MDRRRSAWRGLQTRLFVWFCGAIVFAVAASWVTLEVTRPPPMDRSHAFSRIVTTHLAEIWDQPGAPEAYLAGLTPTLGMELHLVRDPNVTPSRDQGRGPQLTPFSGDRRGPVVLPVVRNGQTLGAMTFEPPYQSPAFFRFFIVPLVYTIILSIAGWLVSRRLARPLENVAVAAERFGSGDLNARARLSTGKRWVANEVEELATTFDQMADRISGVVRDQRELLAAISHELRSPLGRARVALEIARDKTEGTGMDSGVEGFDGGSSGPRTEESSLGPTLARIEIELGEVDTILGDLLASARAGLSDLRKNKVDLAPWLRTRIAAERTPPEIELQVEAELSAEVDLALLGRAVHNLLQNARTHGHPEDQPLIVGLGVVTRGGNAHARIGVRDRGPGFAPELLDRAFEPFVRGDQARTPKTSSSTQTGSMELGGNTGLGLALVRRIAEAHGGVAFARNVDGGGAEVVVELPGTLVAQVSKPALPPMSNVA